jgi:Fic family protein
MKWPVDLSHIDQNLKTLYERLIDKKTILSKNRPIPGIAIKKIAEQLSIEWTYNSNSIEGNTLTLRETQLVLQEGITIKGVSLREHFEAVNHDKAIDYVVSLCKPNYVLCAKDILAVHALVLRSIEDQDAGRIRNSGVRISGANFTPPNAIKVPGLLDELVEYINRNPENLNSLELASVFHHRFVWIHPFFDGNGRTVRLIMNLLLMRDGFPPAIILSNDRKKYYDALNKANTSDYNKLILLIAQALERSLNIYINTLDDTNDLYKPISQLIEEANLPYGQEYLSLLARKGKLDAYKEGRNWLSTQDAIKKYFAKLSR